MSRIELAHLLRRLLRQPGFTLASVLTLALGIGATVAIWSVVYGVLIRPLPYVQSERLVGLWHSAPALGVDKFNQSYGSYTLYRERARSLEDAALYDVTSFAVAGSGEPERVDGARVTASLFSVLGVQPALGRAFSAEETEIGGPDVLVISHGFWQRRFGGARDAVGAVLRVGGRPWEIVGVMPEGFRFPVEDVAFWVPHRIDPGSLADIDFSYDVVARLAAGADAAQASAEVDALLRELPDVYPGALNRQMIEQSGIGAFASPLRDDIVGDVQRPLWVLLAAVGFVLVIACANVANLLLVRTEDRQREFAVRAALGAGRGRLTRQLLSESVLLAGLGGAAGCLLAWLAVRGLVALDPSDLPRIQDVRVDGPVLAFAMAVSLLAGVGFGLLPSLRLGERFLRTALAEGGRGGMAGRAGRRVRNSLVVAQTALALILLFASALMLRTFDALRDVDPGFDRGSVLTLRVALSGPRHDDDGERMRFWTRLVDEARTLPGAGNAAVVRNLPLTDGESNPPYIIEDFPPEPDDPPLVARQNAVSDAYFETLGIPILSGRGLERRDIATDARVVVVSQAFARRFWGDASPLGKRLKRGMATEQSAPWYEVVGVAGDVRDDDLTAAPVEMVYFPLVRESDDETGSVPTTMSLAVSAASIAPESLAPALRDLVRRLDADLPIVRMRTTEEIARTAMARTTFTMTLLVIAGFVSVALGSIGIYGVLAHTVAERTREIGVRMALGADKRRVRAMLLGQGLRLTALGIAIGLAGAFVAGRVLAALLFGVSAADPPSLLAVVVVLVVVTMLASLVPAARAAGVPPATALRYE